MSEFRWKQRHHETGSAIEEWIMQVKHDGHRTFSWAKWTVRWYPKLKKWRVHQMLPGGKTRIGQDYLKLVTIAEFPCDPFAMAFVGEEARAFAETTWRLKHGE